MFYLPKRSLFLPAHLVRGLSFAGTMPLMGAGRAGPSGYNPFKYGTPALLLDSRNITGVAHTAAVDEWADASGNGNDATASDGARPIYVEGDNEIAPGQNLQPYAYFVAASGNFMALDSVVGLGGPFTIALVSKLAATANSNVILGSTSAANIYVTMANDTTSRVAVTLGDGVASFTHGSRGTSANVDVFTRDSSNILRHFLNGVESSTAVEHEGELNIDSIAGRFNGSIMTTFWGGEGYIINIWPSLVSDIGGLVADLKSEFAIA